MKPGNLFVSASFVLLITNMVTCSSHNNKLEIMPTDTVIKRPPIELKAKIVKVEKIREHKAITISTLLINNQWATAHYLNFSCGYSDAFCASNKQLRISVEECNSNYPKLFPLSYAQPEKREVLVVLDSVITAKHLRFKMGFHFIKIKRGDYYRDEWIFSLLADSTNIIWSNILEL
jgi:hypothetical protein